MKNNFRTSDLNNLIIKDKHGRKILNRFFYSRVFVTFLLIAIQIAIFVIFLVKLNSHSEYYFGSSIGLSALFMIYLSNSKGKNEFKIAWLVPIVIFPLFGVVAYIMYHTNMGGLIYKKRFLQLGKTIQSYKNDEKSDLRKLKKYEEVQDLGNYLLTYGKFTPYEKTKVTYYNSGEVFLPELLEQLKKAENFIFIEYFIINVDECWTSILEVLKEKAKKGVTVRVMYDGLGSVTASQSSYQKFLKENGIDSHIFLPLVPFFSTQLNNRDHRKIVVIDGKTAFTGGINLSNEYFNFGKNKFSYWKDNAVKVEGAAVKGFTEMFLQTWNLQTKQEDEYEKYLYAKVKRFDEPGLVIPYGDNAFNDKDIAEDVYQYIINASKKYLYITTPYLVIDNQLMSDLIFAAQRGVKVRIAVPAKPDHLLTFCVGKTFQKNLMDYGIEVYEYQKGFIHAKTFISDGKMATVGSVNLDYRSLYHHFECGCFMYDVPAIKEIEKDFESIVKDSSLMTKETYKKIPAIRRALGRVFRIFSPLI